MAYTLRGLAARGSRPWSEDPRFLPWLTASGECRGWDGASCVPNQWRNTTVDPFSVSTAYDRYAIPDGVDQYLLGMLAGQPERLRAIESAMDPAIVAAWPNQQWRTPEVIPTDPTAPIESIRNPDNPTRLVLQANNQIDVDRVMDNLPILLNQVDPTTAANIASQAHAAAVTVSQNISTGVHTPLVVADAPQNTTTPQPATTTGIITRDPSTLPPGSSAVTTTTTTAATTTTPAAAAAAESIIPGVPNMALYAAAGALALLFLKR